MVQMFSLNSSNDIFIGSDGNLSLSNGVEAVALACKTASLAQLGEEVLTDTQGLPNFQAVWVGTPNYALYESYLRNTLLAVPGVLKVNSITLSASQNVLHYTATLHTQFGPTQISG
jgi:hypothetical protein